MAAHNHRLPAAAMAVKAMLGSENCPDDLADDIVEVIRPHLLLGLQYQLELAQAEVERLKSELSAKS